MPNAYEALDLQPTATGDEIRDAYRQLALEVHPEREANNPNAEADQRTLNLLAQAYTILRDAAHRGRYNAGGMPNLDGTGDGAGVFFEEFKISTLQRGGEIVGWAMVGTIGGFCLGAVFGGPVVGVAAAGAVAGTMRGVLQKPLGSAWKDLKKEEKAACIAVLLQLLADHQKTLAAGGGVVVL